MKPAKRDMAIRLLLRGIIIYFYDYKRNEFKLIHSKVVNFIACLHFHPAKIIRISGK